MIAPTDTERTLLAALLEGEHPALAVLRRQLSEASIVGREFSGVGFFTHFAVPSGTPRLPVRHWVIQDVEVQVDGLDHGGGALLFVIDGALSMLEVFTYGSEAWPEAPIGLRVSYTTRGAISGSGYVVEPSSSRDFAWLAEEFSRLENRAPAS